MIFLLDLLLVAIYFSPTMVALFTDHPRSGLLAVLNLCFGWTGIGWVALMVWAWVGGRKIPAG